MSDTIDKNIPLPLYYQLKQIIINNINDGIYKEEQAIPTEKEFSENYELSRTTVRQAISELVNEDYLYRKKGIGTFVLSQSQDDERYESQNNIYKIDCIIKRNGFLCETKLLNVDVIEVTSEVAKHLEINVGDKVWCMDRIRYADNKPASFSRSYFKKELIENFDQEAHEAAPRFYEYLDKKGYRVDSIKEFLKPGLPDKDVKKTLSLNSNSLIMIVEDTGYLSDGTVLEYSLSVVDVSFIDFTATFKRN